MAPILLGNERAVHRLRVVLLALWASVLSLLVPALENANMRLEVTVVYQTVSRILVRPEFGPQHLLLDAQCRPACDPATLANARRYRRMLRATHCFVVEQLGIATQLSSTQPFTLFAMRTLVVSYFRVPGAATELIAALALTEDELALMPDNDKRSVRPPPVLRASPNLVMSPSSATAIVTTTTTTTTTNNSSNTITTSTTVSTTSSSSSSSSSLTPSTLSVADSSASASTHDGLRRVLSHQADRVPSLYMWPRFHVALIAVERARSGSTTPSTSAPPSAPTSVPSTPPPELAHGPVLFEGESLEDIDAFRSKDTAWLRILQQQGATGRVLYFLFLNEWLQHVRSQMQLDQPRQTTLSHNVWFSVVGFEALAVAFLYHMSTLNAYHKSVLDCSDQLLRATPSVLSAYVRMTFLKTRVFDPLQILSSMSHVERWLGVLRELNQTLPDSFDIDFFLLGLDRIVETDHHQVLMVLLTFIYKNADLFEGNARRQLFGNFLLRRHFYELFLHWDSAVRTTFHQILLFRLVRARRGGTSSLEKLLAEAVIRVPPPEVHAAPVPANGTEASASIPASAIGSSLASALPSPASGALSMDGADAFKGILGRAGVTVASLTSAALAGAMSTAECETDSDAIDAELLSKLEAHLRLLCDQLSEPTAAQVFEGRLVVYSERAQREYLVYLHRFLSWRGQKPPPLVSVADAHGSSKDVLARISSQMNKQQA